MIIRDIHKTDFMTLLTYCKNFHPSKPLRKTANRILEDFITDNLQESLFSDPLYSGSPTEEDQQLQVYKK